VKSSESHKIWCHFRGRDEPRKLDEYIIFKLKEEWRDYPPEDFSKSKVRKLVMSGNVFVNRACVRDVSHELSSGDKIVLQTSPELFFGDHLRVLQEMRSQGTVSVPVLFQDHAIIIIQKNAGLPTQPTVDKSRPSVYSILKESLSPRYVGLHHRLDRDTSGVMVFSADKKFNASIAKIFSEHEVEKEYLCICSLSREFFKKQNKGTIQDIEPKTGVVRGFLKKDNAKNRMIFVRAGGDYAETKWEILSQSGIYCLIRALPRTGRTHQIRVSLAQVGLPILGDTIYGSEVMAPRYFLHAYSLKFKHPDSGKMVSFHASLQEDFLECIRKHHLTLPKAYSRTSSN